MLETVRFNLSGTVAADGTFSINAAPAALGIAYTNCMITARHVIGGVVAGAPRWTYLLSNLPVDYSVGSAVDLGPRLTNPGDQLTIAGDGGQPGAQVLAVVHGIRGSLSEVLQARYAPTPSTLGVQPAGTTTLLGTVSDPSGIGATLIVNAPTSAVGIGYTANLVNLTPPAFISIVGVQSAQEYISDTFQQPLDLLELTRFVPWPGSNTLDTQLKLVLQGSIFGSTANFLATTLPLASYVAGSVHVDNTAFAVAPGGEFPFSAVFSAALGAGGSQLVTNGAGTTIYLGPTLVKANATTDIQLWDGAVGGGTLRGIVPYIVGTPAVPFDFPGIRFNSGTALWIACTVATTVTLTVCYNVLLD